MFNFSFCHIHVIYIALAIPTFKLVYTHIYIVWIIHTYAYTHTYDLFRALTVKLVTCSFPAIHYALLLLVYFEVTWEKSHYFCSQLIVAHTPEICMYVHTNVCMYVHISRLVFEKGFNVAPLLLRINVKFFFAFLSIHASVCRSVVWRAL